MNWESKAAPFSWRVSSNLYARGFKRTARLLKAANFFLFRAVLPPQVQLGNNVSLKHYGLGVVVHPNTTIGDNVTIYHQVTIAAETWIGSPHRVVIEKDVIIGAGAILVAREDTDLRIGVGARIGAGSVVTRSVAAYDIVAGVPARSLRDKVLCATAMGDEDSCEL